MTISMTYIIMKQVASLSLLDECGKAKIIYGASFLDCLVPAT